MTAQQALAVAVQRLKSAAIPDPARDARRLMAHALGVAPGRLTLHLPEEIAAPQHAVFDALIDRRVAREPVSHLVGLRAFYGRDFAVSPAVLDPRPETEILIEQVLRTQFSSVLDLGVGSGCILLTLLAERPNATGLGADLSPAAVEMAQKNAQRLGIAARARFAKGHWYDAVPQEARFDLIVSNPPYIAQDEMPALDPELGYEPRMALTDEGDGLSAYQAIAAGAAGHLTPSGRLAVEIGPTQAAAVTALFQKAGFSGVETHRDFDGRDRVITGVLSPQKR